MDIRSEEMQYRAGDDRISAHLAMPTAAGKYPGVVLIHEIFGLDDHIRKVADRLAGEGYVVLAPHLFSSEKLSGTLSAENIGIAMRFMMSIPVEKQRDDAFRAAALEKLDEQSKAAVKSVNQLLFVNRPIDLFVEYMSAGVDHLQSLGQVSGKIGSVGFCFGGGMSINLACTGRTDASVIFYGENPAPIDKLKGVKGAVMGLYGGEDARINSKLHELVQALIEYKRPLSLKVFPGAFHGFFNDTRAQTYNGPAAEEAWRMVLAFFKDNLAKA